MLSLKDFREERVIPDDNVALAIARVASTRARFAELCQQINLSFSEVRALWASGLESEAQRRQYVSLLKEWNQAHVEFTQAQKELAAREVP